MNIVWEAQFGVVAELEEVKGLILRGGAACTLQLLQVFQEQMDNLCSGL